MCKAEITWGRKTRCQSCGGLLLFSAHFYDVSAVQIAYANTMRQQENIMKVTKHHNYLSNAIVKKSLVWKAGIESVLNGYSVVLYYFKVK
jgi:hypothetical protein